MTRRGKIVLGVVLMEVVCIALVMIPATSAALASWAGIIAGCLLGVLCVALAESWTLIDHKPSVDDDDLVVWTRNLREN